MPSPAPAPRGRRARTSSTATPHSGSVGMRARSSQKPSGSMRPRWRAAGGGMKYDSSGTASAALRSSITRRSVVPDRRTPSTKRRAITAVETSGSSGNVAGVDGERKASDARTQGAPILERIGATEDTAARSFAAARTRRTLPGDPLGQRRIAGDLEKSACQGLQDLALHAGVVADQL